MLIHFSIRNFRSIHDWITLSFEAIKDRKEPDHLLVEPIPGLRLVKAVLLYGPNASGKTNILRALEFVRRLVEEGIERHKPVPVEPFKFHPESRQAPTEFEIEFFIKGNRLLYQGELTAEEVLHERLEAFNRESRRWNMVFERERTGDATFRIRTGKKHPLKSALVDLLYAATPPNNLVLHSISRLNAEGTTIQQAWEWFAHHLGRIITPRHPVERIMAILIDQQPPQERETFLSHIVDLMHQADFSISKIELHEEPLPQEDFEKLVEGLSIGVLKRRNDDASSKPSILRTKFYHRTESGGDQWLWMRDESAGTQRFYGLSGPLITALQRGLVLPIDEIEASLHPDLVKFYLQLFLANTQTSQLIATTHMRELLQEESLFRRDMIWFTDRKPDGSTELFSLADFKRSEIRQKHSIYLAYKKGRLGARPYVGSYQLPFLHKSTP